MWHLPDSQLHGGYLIFGGKRDEGMLHCLKHKHPLPILMPRQATLTCQAFSAAAAPSTCCLRRNSQSHPTPLVAPSSASLIAARRLPALAASLAITLRHRRPCPGGKAGPHNKVLHAGNTGERCHRQHQRCPHHTTRTGPGMRAATGSPGCEGDMGKRLQEARTFFPKEKGT